MRDLKRIAVGRPAVTRFMTGSQTPYRGRNMPLTVRCSDAERIAIAYLNGFIAVAGTAKVSYDIETTI